MRPGPSITLQLLAGGASLALSVRGWHSPELAVLGAGLFVRAGLTWSARGQPPPHPGSRFVLELTRSGGHLDAGDDRSPERSPRAENPSALPAGVPR
jgi:hypothetical protein